MTRAGALPPDVLEELTTLADGPLDRPLPDDVFDDLARRVFAHQWETNGVYRGFCEGRGVSPRAWPGWECVPAVPARGFRELDLVSGDPDDVERTFKTSGTTTRARGRHHVLSLDLYRRLAVPWFRANLLPDLGTVDPIRIVSLVPDPQSVPDSSLSAMVGFVLDAHGDDGSAYVAHRDTGVDTDALIHALEQAVRDGGPVLLLGTAFAFVHMLDALTTRGVAVRLPRGSRAMETGGFKGQSREVPRDELYAEITERTGLPEERIVNEYGMTELLSQFYEPVLRDAVPQKAVPGDPVPRHTAAGEPAILRRHRPPPWMRTRILSPDTLEPVDPGSPGLLQHFDLANVGSVSAVLTEDMGRAEADGFVVLGRTPGAEPRGCSLAMEELLAP